MPSADKGKLLPEIEKALNQVNFLCESIKDANLKLLMIIKELTKEESPKVDTAEVK